MDTYKIYKIEGENFVGKTVTLKEIRYLLVPYKNFTYLEGIVCLEEDGSSWHISNKDANRILDIPEADRYQLVWEDEDVYHDEWAAMHKTDFFKELKEATSETEQCSLEQFKDYWSTLEP